MFCIFLHCSLLGHQLNFIFNIILFPFYLFLDFLWDFQVLLIGLTWKSIKIFLHHQKGYFFGIDKFLSINLISKLCILKVRVRSLLFADWLKRLVDMRPMEIALTEEYKELFHENIINIKNGVRRALTKLINLIMIMRWIYQINEIKGEDKFAG